MGKRADAEPKRGNLLEFEVGTHLGYVQTASVDELRGPLVRVLGHSGDLGDLEPSEIAQLPELYWTHVQTDTLVRAGHMRLVGNFDLPPSSRASPPLRARDTLDRWVVTEGDEKRVCDPLTPEDAKISLRAMTPLEVLREKLLSGWRPSDTV